MIPIPSTDEIYNNLLSYISNNLGEDWKGKPISSLRIILYPIAGVIYLAYLYGGWIYDQIFITKADESALIEFGLIFGLSPNPPSSAVLKAEVKGTDGKIIYAGVRFIYTESQIVYVNQSDVTISSGVGTLSILATTAGTIGNLSIGDTLLFETPQGYFDNTITITGVNVKAKDTEDNDSFREKLIEKMQKPPQGGAIADYISWGKEVGGVENIFPYSALTEGHVDIYVESTDSHVHGIPTSILLTNVLNHINSPYHRPVTAKIATKPIVRIPFIVTIQNLQATDPSIVKASIQNMLYDFLYIRKPYIEGYNDLDTSTLSRLRLEVRVQEVIDGIGNASMDALTFALSSAPKVPISSYTLAKGTMALLDSITYAK